MSDEPSRVPFSASDQPLVPERLQYLRSIRFLFESPNWLANLGWGALAIGSQIVIPFIGNLVLLGYLYEMVEYLHRYPGRVYPDFDIRRFADYLSRGVWPFLVMLILGLPLGLLFVMLYVGGLVGAMIAVESGDAAVQATTAVLVALAVLFVFAVAIVYGMVLIPFSLQAGLTRNMTSEGGLNFRRAKQFLGLMWFDALLASLFINVVTLLLTVLGLLCCYVGLFVTLVPAIFASIHLQYQLYEIYLSRGGEPIPLSEPPTLPPPPPVDAQVVS